MSLDWKTLSHAAFPSTKGWTGEFFSPQSSSLSLNSGINCGYYVQTQLLMLTLFRATRLQPAHLALISTCHKWSHTPQPSGSFPQSMKTTNPRFFFFLNPTLVCCATSPGPHLPVAPKIKITVMCWSGFCPTVSGFGNALALSEI